MGNADPSIPRDYHATEVSRDHVRRYIRRKGIDRIALTDGAGSFFYFAAGDVLR